MPNQSILFSPLRQRGGASPLASGHRYVLEVAPPPGWHIPLTPAPAGALRLTVGGRPPDEAPASMMVRAVGLGDRSFADACVGELEAIRGSFEDSVEDDLQVSVWADRRWFARQLTGRIGGHRMRAIFAMLDVGDHYVWFGLLVRERSQWERGPAAFEHVLQTFHQRHFSELIASVHEVAAPA